MHNLIKFYQPSCVVGYYCSHFMDEEIQVQECENASPKSTQQECKQNESSGLLTQGPSPVSWLPPKAAL